MRSTLRAHSAQRYSVKNTAIYAVVPQKGSLSVAVLFCHCISDEDRPKYSDPIQRFVRHTRGTDDEPP
jgi:hypothetical protein